MEHLKPLFAAIGLTMRVAIEQQKNPFMKAFLNHYASFVEQQTGKPAQETIQEIKQAQKKEFKEFQESLIESIKSATGFADSQDE